MKKHFRTTGEWSQVRDEIRDDEKLYRWRHNFQRGIEFGHESQFAKIHDENRNEKLSEASSPGKREGGWVGTAAAQPHLLLPNQLLELSTQYRHLRVYT
jgi:hypothetical protein